MNVNTGHHYGSIEIFLRKTAGLNALGRYAIPEMARRQ